MPVQDWGGWGWDRFGGRVRLAGGLKPGNGRPFEVLNERHAAATVSNERHAAARAPARCRHMRARASKQW